MMPTASSQGNSGSLEIEHLLSETQAELASLRTELYAQRRAAYEAKTGRASSEEKQRALEQQVHELKQDLAKLAQQKEVEVAAAHARGRDEAMAAMSERVTCAESEAAHSKARAESAEARAESAEAACSQAQASAATASAERTAIAGEREAWHRGREELAARMRAAERRAAEMEEEQVRAEEECTVLREELAAARRDSECASFPARADHRYPHDDDDNRDARLPGSQGGASEASAAEIRQMQETQSLLAAELAESRAAAAAAKAEVSRAQERETQLESENAMLIQRLLNSAKAAATAGGDSKPTQVSEPAQADAASGKGERQQLAVTPRASLDAKVDVAAPGTSDRRSLDALDMAQKVMRLEASRRKLLQEVDEQSVEIDRLFAETARLGEGLRQKQAVATMWETQLKESLAQNSRLTDMLTEQAAWPVTLLDGESEGDVQAGNAQLAVQLMEEKAKVSKLEHQVNELNQQVTQASAKCGDIKQIYYPILGSIETRLLHMKQQRLQILGA